jgi:hypothetical protein
MPAQLPDPPDAGVPVAALLGNRLKPLIPLLLVGLAASVGEAGIGATGANLARLPRQSPSIAQAPRAQDAADVPGASAACLVCHLTFVKEELAKSHQQKGISWTKGHGPSIAHANDEHIGATKPNVTFPRAKVDAACAQCHKQHDVPARKVIERFLDRKLPAKTAAICTDCHGTHRIERANEPPSDIQGPVKDQVRVRKCSR